MKPHGNSLDNQNIHHLYEILKNGRNPLGNLTPKRKL